MSSTLSLHLPEQADDDHFWLSQYGQREALREQQSPTSSQSSSSVVNAASSAASKSPLETAKEIAAHPPRLHRRRSFHYLSQLPKWQHLPHGVQCEVQEAVQGLELVFQPVQLTVVQGLRAISQATLLGWSGPTGSQTARWATVALRACARSGLSLTALFHFGHPDRVRETVERRSIARRSVPRRRRLASKPSPISSLPPPSRSVSVYFSSCETPVY